MSASVKSPWVIHYDASSCNGCDIEVLAALTPLFDVERFGIINTGNPKHADVFLVTGSVNERQISIVRQIYAQMPEPKVVVACGICACTGGVFKECYNTLGGVDVAIPVDVYSPGCAVRPEAIIDAVVVGLGILEEKRARMAAGTYVTPALPAAPTAAEKLVDGIPVCESWKQAVLDAARPVEAEASPAKEASPIKETASTEKISPTEDALAAENIRAPQTPTTKDDE